MSSKPGNHTVAEVHLVFADETWAGSGTQGAAHRDRPRCLLGWLLEQATSAPETIGLRSSAWYHCGWGIQPSKVPAFRKDGIGFQGFFAGGIFGKNGGLSETSP